MCGAVLIMKDEKIVKADEIDQLKSLAFTAIDIVSNLPQEYKKEAFTVFLSYLLEKHMDSKLSKTASVQEAGSRGLIEPIEGIKESLFEEKTRKISLVDFIEMIKTKPKNNAEWITVFAYYKSRYLGEKEFTVKEIPLFFRAAGLRIPGNINRDTKTALSRHYIAQDVTTKDVKASKYYITRKGEELVRGMLNGEKK